MSKVILIEDRSDRRKKLLRRKGINLLPFQSVLFSCEGEDFNKLKKKVKDQNFSKFKDYEVIISHRSAWSQKELDSIKRYCTNKEKALVLFSGGITSSYYSKVPCKLLTMDVEDLYSSNLNMFINHLQESGSFELPRLQYGKKWRLNILLKARNKIATFMERETGIKRISTYVIQDTASNNLGLTSTFYEIQKELGYDMNWYKEGIIENAYPKLVQIKREVNESIKKELFHL